MKCLNIVCLLIMFFTTTLTAQNIIVSQQDNTQSQSANNEYFIDGISTRLDIGGVDVEFVDHPNYLTSKYLKFTNFRNFPVTVIFEVKEGSNSRKVSGRITLMANETKITPNSYQTCDNNDCIMIVRKL